ncbi:hypothetical protein ES707_08693 [subsurface metagenome]
MPLRIKIWDGLLPLGLLVVLLIAVVLVSPSSIWRIVLGVPFLFFFPGYTFGLALFPKKDRIGNIERIAFSFGLSLVTVPFIALILNFTRWGITEESMLYSVTAFILVASVVALVRRQRLLAEERINIEFPLRLPGWGGSTLEKALSVVLVVTVLGAFGVLGYFVAVPGVGERFTEFYILGAEGRIADYPEELVVGEEGRIVVGIVNREHETMSYRVEVVISGVKNTVAGSVVLAHGGKWEEEVSFVPETAGEQQKVEFLLYRQGQSKAYHSLHLRVDVTSAATG